MDTSPTDGLVLYGWTTAIATRFDTISDHRARPARVVRTDRGEAAVATADGLRTVRWAGEPPVTGDWVTVDQERIHAMLPRSSTITRGNASESGDQVLAVNVDLAMIVVGLDQKMSLNRLERALTLVWGGGVSPVVVLSKADMIDDASLDHHLARVSASAAGAEIVVASAVDGRGIEPLHALAGGGATVVLIGASGVGKSTLANLLIGSDVLDTGRTRWGDSKGRHTTIAREMYPTARGGALIDTPGLRGLGLASDGGGVDRAFSDVTELAAACRFRDCRHDSEPGCAVRDVIAPRRLASYRKLLREQADSERRAAVRARVAARRSRRKYERTSEW